MAALHDWVRQLTMVVLLVGLAESLLPRSAVKQSVRFVTGLVVMLALFQPVIMVLRGDLSVGEGVNWAVDDGWGHWIDEGVTWSESNMSAVLDVERARWERSVQAMITLVDGVAAADVTWRYDQDTGHITANVTLQMAAESSTYPGDDAVRELITALVPDVYRVDIDRRGIEELFPPTGHD